MLIISIIILIVAINNFIIVKKNRIYYTGKIERINSKDSITTLEVSPVSSKRYFIAEIKANHQIEYKLDSILVTGVSDPMKNYKRLKMGELGELVKKFKVGDTIIFKVANNNYDKNEYNLEIDEFTVDQTL